MFPDDDDEQGFLFPKTVPKENKTQDILSEDKSSDDFPDDDDEQNFLFPKNDSKENTMEDLMSDDESSDDDDIPFFQCLEKNTIQHPHSEDNLPDNNDVSISLSEDFPDIDDPNFLFPEQEHCPYEHLEDPDECDWGVVHGGIVTPDYIDIPNCGMDDLFDSDDEKAPEEMPLHIRRQRIAEKQELYFNGEN